MTPERRYHVTTGVAGRTITFQHRVDDPFIAHRVTVGWRDLLRGLLRRRLVVEVMVDGDRDIVARDEPQPGTDPAPAVGAALRPAACLLGQLGAVPAQAVVTCPCAWRRFSVVMGVIRAASAVPAWRHALALEIIFHRTEEPEVAHRDDDKDQKKDKDHHDGLPHYFRLVTPVPKVTRF